MTSSLPNSRTDHGVDRPSNGDAAAVNSPLLHRVSFESPSIRSGDEGDDASSPCDGDAEINRIVEASNRSASPPGY